MDTPTHLPDRRRHISARWLVLGVVLIIAAGLLVRFGPGLAFLIEDPQRVQAWLAALGPWGPLGLILLNAAQVVVAPVPGYFVQIAAGYLFGLWAGGLYGLIGMLLGGGCAMLLARWYGRPLVQRMAGEERLQRWEGVIRSDSIWPWFFLLLGPIGDIPYYIAGLTRVAVWKILLIALLLRGPSVFLAAAVGAGSVSISLPWLIALGVALVLGVGLVGRYRAQLEQWVEARVLGRLSTGTWRSKAGDRT